MNAALAELAGETFDFSDVTFSGKTDRQIFREVLEAKRECEAKLERARSLLQSVSDANDAQLPALQRVEEELSSLQQEQAAEHQVLLAEQSAKL